MAIIYHTHTAGNGLTTEQITQLDEAAKYPITYDEDCPELTDEQLAEFRPVNGMTMEEWARAMWEAGITDPDLVPAETTPST